MNIGITIMLIFSIIAFIWGIVYKYRCPQKNRELYIMTPESPGLLGSINFIGFTMLGTFRYANGVSIAYHCFSILGCPLIPFGCYACEKISSEFFSTSYGFGGKQPWKLAEVLSIYSRWFLLVAFFCFFMLFL